jgi:type IV secretory pathway component VirB8
MGWFAPSLLARVMSPNLGARVFLRANVALLSIFQLGESEKQGNVYNILWVLVFGFATLNIIGLVARRFEPSRNRLSFGESLAIMVVVVSVFLLGWEMLYVFGVLPIKLQPHY